MINYLIAKAQEKPEPLGGQDEAKSQEESVLQSSANCSPSKSTDRFQQELDADPRTHPLQTHPIPTPQKGQQQPQVPSGNSGRNPQPPQLTLSRVGNTQERHISHSGRRPAPHLAHGDQGRITGCIQILDQQLDAAGDDTAKERTLRSLLR